MPDYARLVPILAGLGLGGYKEASFNIECVMWEPGASIPVTEQIRHCRITSDAFSSSAGSDPLMRQVQGKYLQRLLNGVPAVSPSGVESIVP